MEKKILVVEDEPEVVNLLRTRLEANHYGVMAAGNGVEGLKQIELEKPDLILLDILMPQMDGYTFLKELKRRKPDWNVPIIVLTAKSRMKELFEAEGVRDYMVKPYDAQDLLERIKKQLGETS